MIVEQNNWVLMTDADTLVSEKEVVTSFRGESAMVMGGNPPHKPSSTGKIHVSWLRDLEHEAPGENVTECYPSVFKCKWVWTGDGDPWADWIVFGNVVEV